MTSVDLTVIAMAMAMTSGNYKSEYNEKNYLSMLFSSFYHLGGSVGGKKYESPGE